MVTFPIDGAKYGRPPPGRHGEAWIMIFGATFDKTEMVDETVVEPFLAGLRGAEQWNASDPVSKEMFSFTTMAFPKSLASVFWEDQCRPPPTDAADVHCRAVDMGGAHGREYLVVTKDPTRFAILRRAADRDPQGPFVPSDVRRRGGREPVRVDLAVDPAATRLPRLAPIP